MPTTLSDPIASLAHRLRGERGQSIVEFAVVLPIFILIIMGILYFGRYENYANQETQLSEQGARWAAINVNPGSSSSQSLQQYIQSQASGELASGSNDVVSPLKAYIYNPTGQSSAVRVCVTATLRIALPIFTTNATLVETSTMHIEQSTTNWTADTPPSQCPLT